MSGTQHSIVQLGGWNGWAAVALQRLRGIIRKCVLLIVWVVLGLGWVVGGAVTPPQTETGPGKGIWERGALAAGAFLVCCGWLEWRGSAFVCPPLLSPSPPPPPPPAMLSTHSINHAVSFLSSSLVRALADCCHALFTLPPVTGCCALAACSKV